MINIDMSGETIHEELMVYHTGYDLCGPKYSFGPFIRDHYLIHFVTKGKGKFQWRGKVYRLKGPCAFIIYPGERTYYEADGKEPWSYYWIGFHGREAEERLAKTQFAEDNPVIYLDEGDEVYNTLEQTLTLDYKKYSEHLKLKGYLYLLLGRLAELNWHNDQENVDMSKIYMDQTVDFVARNYGSGIGVEDIANYLGIDRSYFSRLFTKKMKCSPREYLTQFRIEKAKVLLGNSDLTIGDIARSVGYNDGFTFSKAFKRVTGMSPSLIKERKE